MISLPKPPGRDAYNLTKHGAGAFSEALHQEVTARHVRVSLVEPGATDTELVSHNRAEDIADAISYTVTRPRHVAVNEVLIRPTEQE